MFRINESEEEDPGVLNFLDGRVKRKAVCICLSKERKKEVINVSMSIKIYFSWENVRQPKPESLFSKPYSKII